MAMMEPTPLSNVRGFQAIERALRPFGWECGPEFERRYYTDPWVFNLTNAVVRQSERIEELERQAGIHHHNDGCIHTFPDCGG